jgi:hypothetical protein
MSKDSPTSGLFLIAPPSADEPLLAAVERALHGDSAALAALPALTNLALTDAFLASQLLALHQQWEISPQPAKGLLGRLRARLAWWLLGPEIAQAHRFHATTVRLLDSLLVHIDAERAARRRIEEHFAYRQDGQ